MPPDLHTGFSRGKSGGLVFPSLSEFSTVSCDPHSQSLCTVNKAEIDVFRELSCFFHDPVDVGNLISDSSAFSKTSLNIWKVSIHVLLKPGLENLSITLLVCEMSAIVETLRHWLFNMLNLDSKALTRREGRGFAIRLSFSPISCVFFISVLRDYGDSCSPSSYKQVHHPGCVAGKEEKVFKYLK